MTLNKDTKIIYDELCVEITEVQKKEIEKRILNSDVFWSDGRDCNWMWDFEFEGLYVENYDLKNDFSSVCILITRPDFLTK